MKLFNRSWGRISSIWPPNAKIALCLFEQNPSFSNRPVKKVSGHGSRWERDILAEALCIGPNEMENLSIWVLDCILWWVFTLIQESFRDTCHLGTLSSLYVNVVVLVGKVTHIRFPSIWNVVINDLVIVLEGTLTCVTIPSWYNLLDGHVVVPLRKLTCASFHSPCNVVVINSLVFVIEGTQKYNMH